MNIIILTKMITSGLDTLFKNSSEMKINSTDPTLSSWSNSVDSCDTLSTDLEMAFCLSIVADASGSLLSSSSERDELVILFAFI